MKTKITSKTTGRTLFFFVVSFFTIISSYAQSFQWARSMGGTSSEQGNSVTVDASGNVYTTGFFAGTVDFDPSASVFTLTSAGGDDVFISKLDASGNFVWAKQIGGTGSDFASSIAVDAAGDVYTTGKYSGPVDFDPNAGVNTLTNNGIFISKLSSAGNFVFAKNMTGGGGNVGYGITLDALGNIYTTGRFVGTTDFDPGSAVVNLVSAGNEDIFVSKLDATGTFVWAKKMGGAGIDWANGIAVDGSGNVYTTGKFTGTADFDPGAGTYNSTANNNDAFVSKLDAGGNFVWAGIFAGASQEYGNSIAVDPLGNAYITGSFDGTVDFDPGAGTFSIATSGAQNIFISKLTTTGAFSWAKAIVGANNDVGYSITLNSACNVYSSGIFTSSADFDPGAGNFPLNATLGGVEAYISVLDSLGNFISALSIGGPGTETAFSVDVDPANNIYAAGAFQVTADFDPGVGTYTLTSSGLSDIFVLKLNNSLPTSIKETNNLNHSISVYPNPFTSQITFELRENNGKETELVIFNTLGQIVRTEKSSSDKMIIQRENLVNGIYFYKATQEGNVIASGKIVAE
jgi:hypothetical protein